MEALPIPAYIFDAQERRFLAANNLYCEMVGYTEQELRELPWPKIMPDDFVEPAERAIQTKAPDVPVVWQWRRKDGDIVSAALRYREMTILLNDGRVTTAYFAVVVGKGELPVSAKVMY